MNDANLGYIKNITLSLVFGMALSGAGLYLAFRKVPFADLTDHLVSIDYFWILPSVAVVLTTFVVRVFRWQVILNAACDLPLIVPPARPSPRGGEGSNGFGVPHGRKSQKSGITGYPGPGPCRDRKNRNCNRLNFQQAFHPMMIGFMLNCTLPGRIGEAARPVILQKRDGIPFSTGLATVAAERLFDLGILVILFATVITTVQIDPGLDISFGSHHINKETLDAVCGGMLMICAVLVAGIVMLTMAWTRNIMNRIIMGIPVLFFFAGASFRNKISRKVSIPLVGFVKNLASGFAFVRYPKKICACIGLSLIIWTLQAFSYYVLAAGCPGIGLSFAEHFVVMIIVCFSIALPSAPGFWGVWEAGGVFALSLFGVSSTEAAGFTLTNHVIQISPPIIVGLVSAILTGVNLRAVFGKET